MPAALLAGADEAALASLLQALPGAQHRALADAVRLRQLARRRQAEQREAAQAQIAPALVGGGVRADRIGVEEVDAAVVIAQQADAGADRSGVSGLEREGGGRGGRRRGQGLR